jgi:hypothetical protein
MQVLESRLKAGFYALLVSVFCLFLTFCIWAGIPMSAFTNPCVSNGSSTTCTQLNGYFCPASTLRSESLADSVSNHWSRLF